MIKPILLILVILELTAFCFAWPNYSACITLAALTFITALSITLF